MGYPHRRRLVTLLDVGVMASGSGGGDVEPPVLNDAGVWYRADRGARTKTAAQFVQANGEALYCLANPSLQISPSSPFTFGGWVWLDAAPIANVMGLFQPDGGLTWRMYSETSPRLRMSVSGSGGYVECFGPVTALGTWSFVICSFNPNLGGGLMSVIWNGVLQVQSFNVGTCPAVLPGGAFVLGGSWATGVASGGITGRMQGWFVYGRELTTTEQAFLYNSANGRRYDELTPALKTELRGWWPLNEAAGPRRDLSVNNNTLVDVNTVTSGGGQYFEQAGMGAPVEVWDDSGPNDFDLGVTAANNRPTLVDSERNGRSVARFDGVDDEMHTVLMLGSVLSGPQAQTVFIVQRQSTGNPDSVTYGWDSSGGATNELSAHLAIGTSLYHIGGNAQLGGYTQAVTPLPWTDTWHLVEMVRDGLANNSLTIDGNSLPIVTQNPSTLNPAASAILRISGRAFSPPTYLFKGDIAELIIFNRVFTTVERDAVRNYLKNKWGIAQNKLVVDTARTGYVLVNSTTNDRVAIN
jgi:hypothetical protein